jgi:SulP family sulfate permease
MEPKLLTALPAYSRDALLADMVAGLTGAMVALPLSIAVAIASDADPAKGLVTLSSAAF